MLDAVYAARWDSDIPFQSSSTTEAVLDNLTPERPWATRQFQSSSTTEAVLDRYESAALPLSV